MRRLQKEDIYTFKGTVIHIGKIHFFIGVASETNELALAGNLLQKGCLRSFRRNRHMQAYFHSRSPILHCLIKSLVKVSLRAAPPPESQFKPPFFDKRAAKVLKAVL